MYEYWAASYNPVEEPSKYSSDESWLGIFPLIGFSSKNAHLSRLKLLEKEIQVQQISPLEKNVEKKGLKLLKGFDILETVPEN